MKIEILNQSTHNRCRQSNIFKTNRPSNGVFWIIDDIIIAYPFGSVDSIEVISKSGNTYNHKLLWNHIKPNGNNKPYNYYPRGRVVINCHGKATIYMNPHIDIAYIKDIKKAFGITAEPKLVYDYSKHYKCFLDNT